MKTRINNLRPTVDKLSNVIQQKNVEAFYFFNVLYYLNLHVNQPLLLPHRALSTNR
jgi:hypothetical protein